MQASRVMLVVLLAGCSVNTEPLDSSEVLEAIEACPAGQALRAINPDGTVVCEALVVDEATVDGFVANNGYAGTASLSTVQDEVATARGGQGSLDARLAAIEARLDELEAAHCPPGFTYQPDDGYEICTRSSFDMPDEMVKVGDFWIDRYESNACGPGALGGVTGGDEMGGETTMAFACSRPEVLPQASITWFQAAQMCANAGKRLCTNAEWQTAASGTPDPGDTTDGEECNVSSDAPAATGSHTDCVSRFGAYDMAGNLIEWVADWFAAAGTDGDAGVLLQYAGDENWNPTYGSDRMWNIDGSAIDPDMGGDGWGHRRPAAALRGGSWADGTDGGAFALSLNKAPSASGTAMGARCCAGGG
jgi:formylglycine-generating enzyme required for sulfatase activity